MKNNINILNALNESLEEELKAKRQLKESKRDEELKLNEASFKNKVSAIKKSLKKDDKRLSDKSAEKSAEAIAASMGRKKYGKEEFQKMAQAGKEKKSIKEEDTIKINQVEVKPDYIISDVTVLDPVGDGDVQSPDIEAMLTLVDESLKAEYSNDWGRINVLSSRIDENSSFALVDISTPEILKEFEERGISDAAIGKNLILEKAGKLIEFKVNNLNGTTKYSKKTTNPKQAIYEWLESEFLQEAKEEKIKQAEVTRVKTEKETVENYINNRIDLKQETENIKMFIELSKEVKAKDEMKPSIQRRMYAFAAEMPHSIEVKSNKNDQYELSFSNLDQVVEMIFGKEWVAEPTEDNKVVGVIKENETTLNESYEQFNIGEIEVVFNPETYETLYSIPSADVKDKKINLTKVPTVETPYDTDTIIKSYIETKFGRIPTEEENKAQKDSEVVAQETNVEQSQGEVPVDVDIEDEGLEEDELPDEPTENEPTEIPEENEDIEAETGDAVFMKIRPKQSVSVENLRDRVIDGDTPNSSYIVVDNIDLPTEEFNNLSNNLNEPQPWLEGVKAIDRKNYSFNVVKVTSANANYDLLIDPLGYDYPRYVAIIDKQLN